MSKIFITSDTHFGHNRDFLYESRGFTSILEHDREIIKNWNYIISPDDLVYHLGDIMLGDDNYGLTQLKRLNGQIFIIAGNHDSDVRLKEYEECYNVCGVSFGERIRYKGYNFFLSHYPSITTTRSLQKPLNRSVINLCGHSHTTDRWKDWNLGLIYHCELDAHNMAPVALDQIVKEVTQKYKEATSNDLV